MKTLIALFCGGLVKDSFGKWHSPDFNSGIALYDAPGSRERVVGTFCLWTENSDAIIVALGGKGQMKNIPDAPTLAEAVSEELLELGVSKEKIFEEHESGTTYQQLLALQKISKELSPEKIFVVSNKYHLPRIEAMVGYAPDLKVLKNFAMEFMPAEDVLLGRDPGAWKESIEHAYASFEMKELIKKEEQGVKQIREGTYRW